MKLPFIESHPRTPLLGLGIMYPSPGVIERIGPQWDWLWIDAQHGDMDYRETANLVKASHWIQKPGLVRIPSHDPGWIGKVLDLGAAGIIVPLVERITEAEQMVQAAKFPPVGNRSYGGRRIIDLEGRGYYKTANTHTRLILQVESASACAIAKELAQIEGVDGLFLGPDDLLIRDGLDVDAPKNKENIGRSMQAVAEACRQYNKLSVCVGIGETSMQMAREYRYDLVVGGSDVGFLATGSLAQSREMRSWFTSDLPQDQPQTNVSPGPY